MQHLDDGPDLPVARAAEGRWDAEAGIVTAEYAIATLAAVAFAGVLLAVLRSEEVRAFLLGIVRQALSI